MSTPADELLEIADRLQQRLAGTNLTPLFAKLYSQHTRLSAQRPGLASWGETEGEDRLEEATRLLDAGLLQREVGQDNFRLSLRRAAEILEWLSHPELNEHMLPVALIAAAIYQLAGYPARSSGLLRDDSEVGLESPILKSYLRADFPNLLRHLVRFWSSSGEPSGWNLESEFQASYEVGIWFHGRVVEETASALGIICAALRWGTEPRLNSAIQKLKDVAGLMMQSTHPYSWLLARLCSEVASEYINRSLRSLLTELIGSGLSESGRVALERYCRQAYLAKKAVAWPSQVAGFERLADGSSFALCTPTGSGKTTIAEVAILQSLFAGSGNESSSGETFAPLSLYMVPSRALAAEVESKLSRVLRRLTDERVVVTGLYGGTDWGPTDAWLTSTDRTVLICTYEKTEALMRFLGPLFLDRVRLIVVDEAHTVQFDGFYDNLRTAESRSLRLEALGMRLFSHVERRSCRTIALSAVATGMDEALASWVTGKTGAVPVRSAYRSTRQLIGRLECYSGGRFDIHYDLLDGANTRFAGGGPSDTPYIRDPFPTQPAVLGWSNGPLKRIRPPLFWAAMSLAAPDDKGRRHGVLISITERINEYASDFLDLMEDKWKNISLPDFFREPEKTEDRVGAAKHHLWGRCLKACEDYYGSDSQEFRLLKRGVIVHYGRMPGLMARLLVEVVEERIVSLVMATSTLSEGVNLPFETILIPSLSRYGSGVLSFREFGNLVGRAGRPGVGTEGRALVLICPESGRHVPEIRRHYDHFLDQIQQQGNKAGQSSIAVSPLGELINSIWLQWIDLAKSQDPAEFYNWLETTAPLSFGMDTPDAVPAAVESLDSLDNVLISAAVEVEQLSKEPLSQNEIEHRLRGIWRRSYAVFADANQVALEDIFLHRSAALFNTVYADSRLRRRLYRTCLPPRSGSQLLELYPGLRQVLIRGYPYSLWSTEARLTYIIHVVESVGAIPKFNYSPRVGRSNIPLEDVLAWWLSPKTGAGTLKKGRRVPNQKQVTEWIKYVSSNLGYRFSWGLGSIISLAVDEVHDGELLPTRLEEWPRTGLPWIVFWLKELITWGTLDPVVAYLLSSGMAETRDQAEIISADYHAESASIEDPDARLDASLIRRWAENHFDRLDDQHPLGPPPRLTVNLLRDFGRQVNKVWKVIPIIKKSGQILWTDPAGFGLAQCPLPPSWPATFRDEYDFFLHPKDLCVTSEPYL